MGTLNLNLLFYICNVYSATLYIELHITTVVMSGITIRIRKGDTAPFQYQLTELDLQAKRMIPVDLTNKDVFFYMKSNAFGSVVVDEGVCDIVDDDLAWVAYPFKAGETDIPTMYRVGFKAVDRTTKVVTTYPEPNEYRSLWINIVEDI